MRFRPLLLLALLFLAACGQSPVGAPGSASNLLPGTTPRPLAPTDVPALSVQAAESALVYIDYIVGTDYVTPALTELGYSITVASGWEDFDTKLAAGTYDLAVGMGQGNGYNGNVSVLQSYITGGGHAVAADYARSSTLAAALDASFTGDVNQMTATFLPPVSLGITNPIPLSNPGYGVFSTGLVSTVEGVSYCTFEDVSSCMVVGNEGRTALLGFLSDTPPEADGQQLFENIFSLVNPLVPPVLVDTTPPTITLTTPANGAAYQQGESVTVSYSCADEKGGSGLKSCTGTLADGSTLDTSTPGSYSFMVEAEDNAGNTSSVTHNYTVEASPSTPDTYTIDFEKTVTNKLVYSVKVGSGVTYQGQGSASSATVPVVGKRASNGRILEAQVARVVSIYGSKRLIIGSSNSSNTPNAQGGRIKLSFTNFNPAGAKLTSMTLSNLTKRGAYLTFYYVNGTSSRQNLGTTSAGGSLVVPLNIENLRAVDVYAPNAYSVDDVKFEVAPPR